MSLSFEKFKELRAKGLSIDQIKRFESGEKPIKQKSLLPQEPRKMGFFEKTARFIAPKSVEKFGETIGSALAAGSKDVKQAQEINIQEADAERSLVDAIIKNKKEGKDTLRLENALKNLKGPDFNIRDVFELEGGKSEGSILDKTGKQVAGEALGTLGTVALGAAPASTAFGRIGFGGVLGTTFGAGGALERDESTKNVVTSGLVGGIIGLVLAGTFEGIGALGKKFLPKVGKHTFSKELQPPKKEVVKQVERGFKTFGEKVRELTDDAGKPIYKGTYKTLKKQAENQLKTKGKQLEGLAKQYDPKVKILKGDIVKGIVEQMENTFGKLKPSQIKNIKLEMNRMPNNMNVSHALKMKRLYDGLIPDSFWLKAGDPNVAFNSQIKYLLRDNLRKTINSKTNNSVMASLNNQLSMAMDMKHLTSEQIASRITRKISGEGGFFYKLIGRFIDDFLFNPAITTRASQATLRAGQKTGQTPLRAGARALGIKETAEKLPRVLPE